MATSLALIILLGLLSKSLFEKMKLPGLLGMIILGVVIGPYGINILSRDILNSSADLRKISLVIILLRAGFGIEKEDIKAVGRPAINMSFIPVIFEGFTLIFASMIIFNFSFIEGGMLGFILAAVSPAVIVPSMLELMDKGFGKAKKIPTLILAAASIDDIFAITIFTAFLGVYNGEAVQLGWRILGIISSIGLGLILGLVVAKLMIEVFEKIEISTSKKTLYLIASAILMTSLEAVLEDRIAIASLLTVMIFSFYIGEKLEEESSLMSKALNKIWIFAELILFVLVGAEVNIALALGAGFKGVVLIALGLLARSLAVLISLLGSDLNKKERLFCILAYLPKATVQAAIGGIPLAMGVESGDLILSLAVLAIIITAPLGAIAIKFSADKLLV